MIKGVMISRAIAEMPEPSSPVTALKYNHVSGRQLLTQQVLCVQIKVRCSVHKNAGAVSQVLVQNGQNVKKR